METEWSEIGVIRSVQPLRREVRIKPEFGLEELVAEQGWINVRMRDGSVLRCRVEQARVASPEVVMLLAPGVTRDGIGKMKGAGVLMKTADIPELAVLPWKVEEFLGLHVFNEDGVDLGMVPEVYSARGNAAFVVELPDGTRWVLPAIPEVVKLVDAEAEKLVLGDVRPYVVVEGDEEDGQRHAN